MRFGTTTWQSLCLVVILACVPDSSWAAERLTIGQLQKFHKSYHMHSVTIVGKVEELQVSPPMRVITKSCYTLYGRGKFILVDDSGSLQVESLGGCSPTGAQILPQASDQIELTAQIQVYAPEGQTTEVIKAITQEIVVLK
jgi:hypothetical protein